MIRPDFHNSFAGHSFYTPFLYGKVSSWWDVIELALSTRDGILSRFAAEEYYVIARNIGWRCEVCSNCDVFFPVV
jgi:hypothetical protein